MHSRSLIASLALVAGLGACHSNASDTDTTPTPAYKASASDSTGTARTVQLQSENNSGITGSATLTPAGTETRVTLTLVPPAGGSASGQSHVAHIHKGTCAAPGEVVAPLGTVTASGETFAPLSKTVSISASTLTDGQHIVAAHATEDPSSATVACAQLSSM